MFKDKYYKKLMVGNIEIPSNVLMAPLAGYTNYPFRVMVEELGAGLAFTEMVSVNGLKHKDQATEKLLYTTDDEKIKSVQLLGSIPEMFERAARSNILEKYDIIDINMGCPVPNVVKNGEGSALTDNIDTAVKIVEACKRSGKVVTVKTRLGLNKSKINIINFVKEIEQAGADMITIHGRTRDMMYDGNIMYDYIAKAKDAVSIPIIANGGIYSEEDAIKMMYETNVDGIMLARYGFENPLLFSELTNTPTTLTKEDLLYKQIEISNNVFDNELDTLKHIKRLVSYFSKKLIGSKIYKMKIYESNDLNEIKDLIHEMYLNGGTN